MGRLRREPSILAAVHVAPQGQVAMAPPPAAPAAGPGSRRRCRLLPLSALLAAAGVTIHSSWRPNRAREYVGSTLEAFADVGRPPTAGPPDSVAGSRELVGRRELAALVGHGAWLVGAGVAQAGVEENPIIRDARQEASAKKPRSFLNPENYKYRSKNYEVDDVQSFLPTVLLIRRALATVTVQLDDPRVNTSTPFTYQLLREQNRVEPIKLVRKESYRTKRWLDLNLPAAEQATIRQEYDRVKKTLDDYDAQCLALSRLAYPVEVGARKSLKKSIGVAIDSIDVFLELVPEEIMTKATDAADSQTITMVTLPFADKYYKPGQAPRAGMPEPALAAPATPEPAPSSETASAQTTTPETAPDASTEPSAKELAPA